MVSPIGIGKESYWQALKEGKNGVGIITLFDASKFPVRIAAEVKDFSPDKWMDHKEARRSDRVIQFAVAAADMAIEDAFDVGPDPTSSASTGRCIAVATSRQYKVIEKALSRQPLYSDDDKRPPGLRGDKT